MTLIVAPVLRILYNDIAYHVMVFRFQGFVQKIIDFYFSCRALSEGTIPIHMEVKRLKLISGSRIVNIDVGIKIRFGIAVGINNQNLHLSGSR